MSLWQLNAPGYGFLLCNYYLRKADKLDFKDSNEVDDTMAPGRQFQSAIVLGKYKHLKMSLFAYGTFVSRNVELNIFGYLYQQDNELVCT